MIRLKNLIAENVWYEDIPKHFDEAVKKVDAEIAEAQARKKKIAAVKRDWPKHYKLLADWGWGKGVTKNMTDEEFNKTIRKYEERLWDAGVIYPHYRIET